jgi:cytochrome c oxidase subunit III
MASTATGGYYVPHGSKWPIIGSVSLFTMMFGAASWMNEASFGKPLFFAGMAAILLMLFGWFRDVIGESVRGVYKDQEDMSFRMGMVWFIFSEVMFFAAFFGALYYARHFSLPWLGGEGDGFSTNQNLYDGYVSSWPSNGPGDVGGAFKTIGPWGLPLLNTIILLTSGTTLTIAHWALKVNQRFWLVFWMAATVALGCLFLYCQGIEYVHAYHELNLTLESGVYGSTFFMLTGFHGLHVTLGTIMLAIITLRCMAGHFSKDQHFGFEAVAWYWHFVDVVWLGLFVFVYVL